MRSGEAKNLIFGFFVVVVLLTLIILSYQFYQNENQPINLTLLQYSYYSLDSNSGEDLNSSLTAAEKITACPNGYCAINKNSGIKRCPSSESRVTYNSALEACTRKSWCDYTGLPYALNLDGSTNFSQCSGETPCNCVEFERCKNSEINYFQITTGQIAASENSSVVIELENGEYNSIYGYRSIEISDPSTQFCQINPGFTNEIYRGCDFKNNISSKLGCQQITSTVLAEVTGLSNIGNNGGLILKSVPDDTPCIQGSDTVNNNYILEGQNYAIMVTNKSREEYPSQGVLYFYQVGNEENEYEIVKYTKITYNCTQQGSDTFSKFGGIQSLIAKISGVPTFINTSRGFRGTWKLDDSVTAVSYDQLISKNCTGEITGVNYKNMLLCTQRDSQFCPKGNMAYNFNKLATPGLTETQVGELVSSDIGFSRNFCQFYPKAGVQALPSNPRWMQDPQFFTISCVVGSGCGGLDSEGNPLSMKEISEKFFPTFDADGIRGVWTLFGDGFPYVSKVLTNYGTDSFFNLSNINPGDFWSIQPISENLITTSTSAGSIIYVNSLLGLANLLGNSNIQANVPTGTEVQYRNSDDETVPVQTASLFQIGIETINNKPSQYLVLDPPGITGTLGPNISLTVFSPISRETVGNIPQHGIIVSKRIGSSKVRQKFFADSNGDIVAVNNGVPIMIVDQQVSINIYKQFSFSGGNYNTIPTGGEGAVPENTSSGLFCARILGGGIGGPERIINGDVTFNGVQTALSPYDDSLITSANLGGRLSLSDNQKIYFPVSSETAPFKIPLSMYYPVWNPVISKQECVMCNPLLIAYPVINDSGNGTGPINRIVIQFSGRDFIHYQKNMLDNNFIFTSFSEVGSQKIAGTTIPSTTETIYMKEPNLQVRVGDFVFDSTLQLEYDVRIIGESLPSTTNLANLTLEGKSGSMYKEFYNPSKGITGMETSTSSYIIGPNAEPLIENSELSVKIVNNTTGTFKRGGVSSSGFYTGPENYFFGKKYIVQSKENNNQYYIVTLIPKTRVISISADRRTISLNTNIVQQLEIPEKNNLYLQFCRLNATPLNDPSGKVVDNSLRLSLCNTFDVPCVVGYPGDDLGSGGEIEISQMTDGRITKIDVVSPGINYVAETPPIVRPTFYFAT